MRCSLIEALFDAREEPYGNCKSWRCFIMTGSLCRKLAIRLGGFPNSIRRIIFPVKNVYILSAEKYIFVFCLWQDDVLLLGAEVKKLQQSANYYKFFPFIIMYIGLSHAAKKGGKNSEKAIADAGSGIHGMHAGAEQCCIANAGACRK